MIKVRGLSKRYQLGERSGHDSFRETIVATLKAAGRLLNWSKGDRSNQAHIWALHDLSFDVMPGDVLGVVGRNGGGKSTLLKLISRITHPTRGQIALYGRVGSLLEVGTGFHPELTGRENIFLNGAILGMKRREITKKFDEIVAFSGVEKFLDTPVKRYSSGMYVRLAFAVAAHLDPEILLVDEVLAVGDGEFQKKCLGKMSEVARGGRTVLFVSHNLAAVESLCKSAIFLDSGGLKMIGKPTDVVAAYSRMITDGGAMFADLQEHSGRWRDSSPMMQKVSVMSNGAEPLIIRTGDDIVVTVDFDSATPVKPCFGFTIKTDYGTRIAHLSDYYSNQLSGLAATSSGVVSCDINDLQLLPGRYLLDLWLTDFGQPNLCDFVADACWFEVSPSDVFGAGKLPPTSDGPVLFRGQWSFHEIPTGESSAFGAVREVANF